MTTITMRTITTTLATALAIALSGCALSNSAPNTGSSVASSASAPSISGNLHGGQQPISGASIQIYAVGITGLQSAATPLLTSPAISNANGNFTFPTWDCTSNTLTYGADPLIYVVATQGNPGLGGTVNNTAIAAIASIGLCSTFTTSSFVSINERTTIAAVYALAPFMSDYAHIGSSGAKPTGLVNAFQTASLLANPNTGAVPGPNLPANGTVPAAEINTLANILAPCINSNGSDGNCASLFTNTTPSGGSAPTDTVAAALNIVRNPTAHVSDLFNLPVATPPYQPVLASSPNDWTLAVNFTGGGLNSPAGLAVDSSGNVWVANAGGNAITELSSTGTLLTGDSGYTADNSIFGAQAIAVDRIGNVWLADTLLSSVVKVTLSSGTIQSFATFTGGGISGPTSLAIDSANNVWVANFAGASVTQLDASGSPLGASPLTANGTLQSPISIAIDATGNAWLADNAASIVAKFDPNQNLLSGSGFADSAISAPQGIAFDSLGQAWVPDNGLAVVSLFSPTGAASSNSPLSGGGLAQPNAVAIDASDGIWITNSSGSGITHLVSNTIAAGQLGSISAPVAIAVDSSGSIWTANSGDNSITKFIGIAAPTATPLATHAGP